MTIPAQGKRSFVITGPLITVAYYDILQQIKANALVKCFI